MTDLKAQTRAQCEQVKIDLQDEETRAARKERTARPKNRPNPIKVISRSRSSSIAPATPVHLEMLANQSTPSLYSIDGDETQHAHMLIDSEPDAEDANSPTPTADIPLAVPAAPPPDPVMAILTAIQAQMAQTDARLKAIKTGKSRTTAGNQNNDNAWGEEYGFDPSIGVGEVGRDAGYEDYCTPEQASALAAIQFEKDWIENSATYEAHCNAPSWALS
jgi:hypothetical protein